MFSWIGNQVSGVLSSAQNFHAPSWLQALAWLAALFAAVIAGISLRRQSFQSRAKLLLDIHGRWENLETQRHVFSNLYRQTRNHGLKKYVKHRPEDRLQLVRNDLKNQFIALREKADKDKQFLEIMEFMSFFELLGTYVRNGYLPLRDAAQVYKGPILDVEIALNDFILAWQREADMHSGLFENALYLMKRMKLYEYHKVYYWTCYRPLLFVPGVRHLVI
jgi:hypothetical protein